MLNQEIGRIFRGIAKILELKAENPFRIRAYERAAQNIEGLTQNISLLAEEDKLTTLAGIGKDLAEKIKEIVQTGKLKYYEELKREVPAGLLEMLEIPGLGPKTVKRIYAQLKIKNIKELEEAAKEGRLRQLNGIRERTEENILRGIKLLKRGAERVPLGFALNLARGFLEGLSKLEEIGRLAGSLRRRKETIRDIDILVVSRKSQVVMEGFVNLSLVKEVLAKGETKSSVIAKENDMQVDLRVVEEKSFGSALMYFTGSKDFNIKLRQLALRHNLKISEYGVFSLKGDKEKYLAGKSEEEVFSLLKLAYIPPELREDRGEIEAAQKNNLPVLVERKDILGDLHVHSNYSDGFASLEEIAQEAQNFNYKYVGVCDHSQGLKIAGGLSSKEVYRKIESIRKINLKSKVRLLCGVEVDIDSQGRLDYPDSLLKGFDIVIAAIHTGFKQSSSQLTKRIISACKNKYVHIIAHPTGRLWGVREPYAVEEILKVAKDYKVALEINCYPQRLDLNDLGAMQAKNKGVKLSLGSDSHHLDQFKAIELGLSVARRGWLEKEDLLNCLELEELLKWLKVP